MPDNEKDLKRIAAMPGMNQKAGSIAKAAPLSGEMDAANDPEVERMLTQLKRAMWGQDMYGQALSQNPLELHDIKMEAAERYTQLKEQADAARGRREAEAQQRRDREIAEEKNKLDAERVRIEESTARGKLMIEQQRVEIEKATVVMNAIEKLGANPLLMDKFGPLMEALGQRLLTGVDTGVRDVEIKALKQLETEDK